ncbi:MAG: hypothetical protein CMJ52_09195 [Planctomycetaceae bacterium]|nr:hypothetical protein [Planctomycetaceae bacterium]
MKETWTSRHDAWFAGERNSYDHRPYAGRILAPMNALIHRFVGGRDEGDLPSSKSCIDHFAASIPFRRLPVAGGGRNRLKYGRSSGDFVELRQSAPEHPNRDTDSSRPRSEDDPRHSKCPDRRNRDGRVPGVRNDR